ncbi:MAG TPA: hypothetical protein VGI20_07215 [Rhizomicrobium sp.]|jgi:hypothetical protein
MSSGETKTAALIPVQLVLGLVFAGSLAFVAFFALLAYAPDFREDTDAGAHAISRSAIGFAALRFLLEDTGSPVVIDRGTLRHDQVAPAITILMPGPENTRAEMEAFVNQEPRLIILPKWLSFSDPIQRGQVVKIGLFGERSITALLKSLSPGSSIARAHGETSPSLRIAWPDADIVVPRGLARIDSLQTLHGSDWEPILVSRGGGAVFARLRFSEVYVLADPDLMNTHGLHDLPTAAMALSMVRFAAIGSGPVVFDTTLNGFRRNPSLLRDIFAPPFLGATLCAVLAAMLLGFHALSQFGSPEAPARAFALGKAALVANSAELIRVMHREPQMALRYALATRNLALAAVGARRDATEGDALIAALERRGGASFAQLLSRARATGTRADLVECAGELFRWRQRISHGA